MPQFWQSYEHNKQQKYVLARTKFAIPSLHCLILLPNQKPVIHFDSFLCVSRIRDGRGILERKESSFEAT